MIQTWRDIPGFFNFQDVYELAIVEAQPGDTLVEVGTFLGKSAAYMQTSIECSKKPINFLCVDQWFWDSEDAEWWKMLDACPPDPWPCPELEGMTLFKAFLAATTLAKRPLRWLRSPSVDAAEMFKDRSLSFVFIDANHNYGPVKSDIAAWLPKIRPGGIIAGHDYHAADWPGVTQAVDEAFGDRVQQMGTSWLVRV